MISFGPAANLLRRKLGADVSRLECRAVESWQIAPETRRYIARAVYLPGQLERIRDTEFAGIDDVVRAFNGNHETVAGATFGYRLKHVDLFDGVLHSGSAQMHLRARKHRLPAYIVPREVAKGALYESWVGNRWFGNWLSDDCLTYRLAERFGSPVSTTTAPAGHVPHYESLLGIAPRRLDQVHFDELVIFDDSQHNDGRKERANDLRNRIVSGTKSPCPEHPGTFLLRGGSGMKRVLVNEYAIAERLAAKRGFKILDPSTASVEEIVEACASARCVAGVEGSQLVHGLVVMPPDASLLVLQPPTRVVAALKLITDRQGQRYGLVVGQETDDDEFSVDVNEVERTIDLLAAQPAL